MNGVLFAVRLRTNEEVPASADVWILRAGRDAASIHALLHEILSHGSQAVWGLIEKFVARRDYWYAVAEGCAIFVHLNGDGVLGIDFRRHSTSKIHSHPSDILIRQNHAVGGLAITMAPRKDN